MPAKHPQPEMTENSCNTYRSCRVGSYLPFLLLYTVSKLIIAGLSDISGTESVVVSCEMLKMKETIFPETAASVHDSLQR